MMGKILKGVGIVVVTSILATVSIDAADNLGNFKHSLLGAAVFGVIGEPAPCPDDMVFVDSPDGGFCIDRYEASAGEECPYPVPANQDETRLNLAAKGCVPQSVPDAVPWTNIAEHQAEALCAKAGKRLPTHAEWYRAALGTPDGDGIRVCNIGNTAANSPTRTGSHAECVSSWGAYDMIGNVWEWVGETFTDGIYRERELPDRGYVHGVDTASGVPTQTGETPDTAFNNDYFWVRKDGVRGVFRGGFWGLGERAGLYAVHGEVTPEFVGVGVGVRCAASANR